MHAPYMLEKYKENPKFINKIKYLTENLAKLEIKDFFEIIDLTTNQDKNQENNNWRTNFLFYFFGIDIYSYIN